MRRIVATLLALVATAILLGASRLAAADVLLDANFDNEVVNQNIPTGGAIAGEPVSVDVAGMAVVRHAAFATPSLQIIDPSTTGSRTVVFEFLGATEVGTGQFKISMNLRFAELGNYEILVREQGGAAQNFLDMNFTESGFLVFNPGQSVTYDTTGPMKLELTFDMDQRTYSATIDDVSVVENVAFGGSISRGIGSLIIGNGFDTDLNGDFNLDDLHVETIPDPIFKDQFGDP